jgi:hypothetical protein
MNGRMMKKYTALFLLFCLFLPFRVCAEEECNKPHATVAASVSNVSGSLNGTWAGNSIQIGVAQKSDFVRILWRPENQTEWKSFETGRVESGFGEHFDIAVPADSRLGYCVKADELDAEKHILSHHGCFCLSPNIDG